MHLIQQMPFQSAQSPTAMFKPLRQQVFSSHIKKPMLCIGFFRPIQLFWFTAIRLSYGSTALTGAHEDIQRISSRDNRVTVTTVTPENAQHFLLQFKRVFPSDSPVFDSGYLVEAALVAFVV